MSFKYTKKIIPASTRFENNGDAPILFRNPVHDTNLLCSYFTDDPDTESWSWEWLTEDQLLRDAKL